MKPISNSLWITFSFCSSSSFFAFSTVYFSNTIRKDAVRFNTRREQLGSTQGAFPIKPYPFHLACPLYKKPETLGDICEWLAEWKWGGIRCQLIRDESETFIFSRTGRPITGAFPEIIAAADRLADGTVLDGNILGWKEGEVLPAHLMQRRGETQNPDEELLRDVPVAFMAFDILVHEHNDVRTNPLVERRHLLTQLLSPGALDAAPSCRGQLHPSLRVSTIITASSWQDLAESHNMCKKLNVAGMILKRAVSPYAVGRSEGDWWKWDQN